MPIAFLPDRAVVSITGADARAFLQNLVTCDVDILTPGNAAFGALLTPQGKILADFFVVCAAEDFFWLDASASVATDLVKRLSLYKLRAKVAVAATTKQVVAFWGLGAAPEGLIAFRDPRATEAGTRVILDTVDHTGDTIGYEAHRIALGIPKGGVDFPWGDAFPHEVNMDLLAGVSFEKGCYVGQEVVSRMQHRGSNRRRVLRATFEGIAPPIGTEIRAGDTLIGTLGSTSDGQGLAAVRVDRLADATAARAIPMAGTTPLQLAPIP